MSLLRLSIITFLAVILWLHGPQLMAQYRVEGIVVDSLLHPLPAVSVLLERQSDSVLVAFGHTDGDGRYQLAADSAGYYLLSFRRLGLQLRRVSIEVAGNPGGLTEVRDITMSDAVLELGEVTVEAEAPIRIRPDTIDIRVGAFTSGTEVVLEDVLRKLPGVNVDATGAIRVLGKPVEKVLIGGDDIFDDGYRLLTRNLDAKVIGRVQILQRFDDNPVLRGIRTSDRVALNIDLKESVRHSWFGKADLGGGLPGYHENRANVFRIAERTKYLFFANLNNTGTDGLGDIYPFLYPEPDENQGYPGEDKGIQPFLNRFPAISGVAADRQNFNTAGLVSGGAHWGIGANWKVRAIMALSNDEQEYLQRELEDFRSPDLVFRNAEERSLRQRSQWGLGRWSAVYQSGDTRIQAVIRTQLGSTHQHEEIAFNGDPLTWQGREQEHHWDARLAFARKLDNSRAILLAGHWNSGSDEVTTKGNTRQDLDQSLHYGGIRGTFHSNRAGLLLESAIGVDLAWADMQNLGGPDLLTSLDAANSNTRLYLRNRLETNLGTGIRLLPEMELVYIRNRYSEGTGQELSRLFALPQLGLRWRPGAGRLLTASYRYSLHTSDIRQQFSAAVRTNFRDLVRGLGAFGTYRAHNFLLSYTHGTIGDASRLHGSLVYTIQPNYPGSSAVVQQAGTLTTWEWLGKRSFLSLHMEYDQYIAGLASNLKMAIGYTSGTYPDRLNGTERSIQNRGMQIGPEWRTAFGLGFDLHAGTRWSWGSYQGDGLYADNLSNTSFLDMEFNAGDRWRLRWRQERFGYGNASGIDPIYFSDLSLHYGTSRQRVRLRVEFRNTWNVRRFRQFQPADTGSFTREALLLPRQILFHADIRL